MLNLLRADFLKAKKDKTIIVALVVLLFFAVVEMVILLVMDELIDFEDAGEMAEYLSIYNNGQSLFLNSFYLSNNVGLVVPIIICLFVGKEFSYGTIRNKLIVGKSRTSVYFSNLISGVVLGILLITFYAIISLIFGLLIGYGSVIDGSEIVFILKTYFVGILMYMVSFSLSVFMTLITKNQTMAIILTLVILLLLGVIVMSLTGINSTLDDIFQLTIFGQSLTLINGVYTNSFVLKVVITSVIYVAGISALGSYIFKKSDLK